MLECREWGSLETPELAYWEATDDQQDSAECFCTVARMFAERFNSSWDATRIKEAIQCITNKNIKE
jgi:hypothetical protein